MTSADVEEHAAARTSVIKTTNGIGDKRIGHRGYRAGPGTASGPLPSTVSPMNATYTKAAAVGAVAGLVAGLFGVGGGIIVVPGLVLWLAVSQREASGTSIATIVATSAAALVSFEISGYVDWMAAGLVFIGAAVGAVIGARLATQLPERTLTAAFAVILLIAGVRMLF